MIKSLPFFVVLAFAWTLVVISAATLPPVSTTDSASAYFHAAIRRTTSPTSPHRLRHNTSSITSLQHAIVPIERPTIRRHTATLRRLFGLDNLWSWFSDKRKDEMLDQAKDKLAAMRHNVSEKEEREKEKKTTKHRRLQQYELGPTFHTLRFFANRIGEVNDKAFTAQEEEAARLAALGSRSSSSSSSMDADARKAAAVEVSRVKAAEAYGLATPTVTPPAVPTTVPPPTARPSPTPTKQQSLLPGMAW